MVKLFKFGDIQRFLSRGFKRDRASIIRYELRNLVRKEFDPKFFVCSYRDLFPDLEKRTAAELLDLYLDKAAENKLDPCESFSEEKYVDAYIDLQPAIRCGDFACGFHHWLKYGVHEGRRAFPSSKASPQAQSLSEAKLNIQNLGAFKDVSVERWEKYFDREWYGAWLNETYGENVSNNKLLDHFLRVGLWRGDVPSPFFDENFYVQYYEDILLAKQKGLLPSGYAHFVLNGENEGRLPAHDVKTCLSHKLGALALPTGLQCEVELARKFRPIPSKLDSNKPRALNVFVPSLDPDIMFGGYIAFLSFLCCVAEQGTPLRFIVTEDGQSNRNWFLGNIRNRWREAFAEADFLTVSEPNRAVIVGNPDDLCIAYSAWTAYLASAHAKNLRTKRIIYFIQEDERIFHEHNSLHFLVSDAYSLDHAAIFNTSALEDYFRTGKIGVFAREPARSFLTFEHAITSIKPNLTAMRNKGHKKLFVYCRPEGHAGRNLFEICVMVLRRCVEKDILDSSWELIGLGSMGYEGEIDLGAGVKLLIRSRVSLEEYEGLIQSFDVGLSLMWAPHPSVTPYELALAGVVCVTNIYGYRDKAYFENFGFNIVAAEPSIDALAEGVREAVKRSSDFDARIKGAKISLPTDWQKVFTPQFVRDALSLYDDG